jgi:hypothetical protein
VSRVEAIALPKRRAREIYVFLSAIRDLLIASIDFTDARVTFSAQLRTFVYSRIVKKFGSRTPIPSLSNLCSSECYIFWSSLSILLTNQDTGLPTVLIIFAPF